MKQFFFFIVLASALFSRELPFPWVVYEDQIRYYLDGKSYEIDGKFYSYDFNNNGKIDYNDWIYISQTGTTYRLFGVDPTSNNRFGWQEIKLPHDFITKGKFQGYYIFINYPHDKESVYSWIYISRNGNIYKLISNRLSWENDFFSKKLKFEKLDILTASIENRKVSFHIPLHLSPFQFNTAGQDLQKITQLNNLDSFIFGYQKFSGEWMRVASKEFSIPMYIMGDEWNNYLYTELQSFEKELNSLFSQRISYEDAILRLRNHGQLIIFKNFAKITNWNRYKSDAANCAEGLPKIYELLRFDSNIDAIYTPIQATNTIFKIASYSSSSPNLIIEPIKLYKGCLIVYSHQSGCDSVDGHIFANSFDLLCRIYKEKE